MSIFKGNNINDGVSEYKNTRGAILIDVRDPAEFGRGHIPGSINMPLNVIDARSSEISQKSAPIYLYCVSGARASQALNILKSQGFTNVKNIGGINSYKGELEKSKGRSF